MFKLLLIIAFFYVIICILVYFSQEKLIFHPDKLAINHPFYFDAVFEELFLEVDSDIRLHALHFKVNDPKGIVFYVHGNAGSLQDWGHLHELYKSLGYDLFMFDYRGFGKSNGSIITENQFFEDVQKMYDYVKKMYDEAQIIVQSFSIGSAAAAKIVAENHPRKFIMKAPYFSLEKLVRARYFMLPKMLLKYPFYTFNYLEKIQVPVVIFHGTADELIPFSQSKLLKSHVPRLELLLIQGCLHNDIPYAQLYCKTMAELLD